MRMGFTFHPQRSDAKLSLRKDGAALYVNGEAFDFTGLLDGASLPVAALDSPVFAGPVWRQGRQINFDLFLPHGPDAGDLRRFPRQISTGLDGQIDLPAIHGPMSWAT